MPEIWPPPPEHQTPPVLPPPEPDRDLLIAALIALALVPVNAVLVFIIPGPHSAPHWWPYAFAAAFGGLLMCWMYGFFGGLLHWHSRLARLGLITSVATVGLCLLAFQAAHWLKL